MTGQYRIHETGGPEKLIWEDVDLGEPAADQVLIRHTAIGLNFIDTYHRSGLYPLALPSALGVEAAGVIEAVGAEVVELKVGDRVGYAASGLGAYGEANLLPAGRVVKLPDNIDDETAAAVLLKGLTACFLIHRTYPVTPETTLLSHAAAGGVGLILCQWAKHLGARVIGTVGNAAKAELARQNGCDHTILYNEEDVVAKVREITGGVGVNVAYDSVGKSTFDITMDSLAPLGMFVSFGNASGNAPAVEPMTLMLKGSLFFTRPSLGSYGAKTEDLRTMADQLFSVIANGTVKAHINQRYPLSELAQAHRDLEGRKTTGSTVLIPGT